MAIFRGPLEIVKQFFADGKRLDVERRDAGKTVFERSYSIPQRKER
jgi:hypothetical protein